MEKILIVAIFILLGVFYFLGQNDNSNSIFNQTTTIKKTSSDQTKNWKIFSDNNYSIKYPVNFIYSTNSLEGAGGQVRLDHFKPANNNYTIYIYSYDQEINPRLEFNLEVAEVTSAYLAGQTTKRLTSKDGTLIHLGPLNSWGKNYLIVYSSGTNKPQTEIFELMLSTFKFLK